MQVLWAGNRSRLDHRSLLINQNLNQHDAVCFTGRYFRLWHVDRSGVQHAACNRFGLLVGISRILRFGCRRGVGWRLISSWLCPRFGLPGVTLSPRLLLLFTRWLPLERLFNDDPFLLRRNVVRSSCRVLRRIGSTFRQHEGTQKLLLEGLVLFSVE